MSALQRLRELGLTLPPPVKPAANFVMAVGTGKLLFLSGQISREGDRVIAGKLGAPLTVEEGQVAARSVGLALLSTLQDEVGLDRVRRVVKLLGLVHSAPDFTQQHLVMNGCSDVIAAVLGERGVHARSAIGVAQLPFGAAVEAEMIVEVE